MFAQGWPRDKFVHACNVLAQMLDNDQDGCADDTRVVKYMRLNQSGMVMFQNENSEDYGLLPRSFNGQGLYATETEMGCSGKDETRNCRDAALEEILHVITASGLSPAYPNTYSECYDGNQSNLSTLQKEMDDARGGHFKNVPSRYPSNAIYHYYDRTCDYQCQGTEFLYWIVTSYLDGQDARKNGNAEEWEASTKTELRQKLPTMYNLLNRGGGSGGTTMVLFSSNGVLPGAGGSGAAATYRPSSQRCNGGCALDGTGCGILGNKREVDPCDDDNSIDEEPTSSPVSQPSPTPPTNNPPDDGCADSPLKFKNMDWTRDCAWVAKNPTQRCKTIKRKSHCPVTCNAPWFCTRNSQMRWALAENGNFKKCWFIRNKKETRCAKMGMCDNCRGTCSGYDGCTSVP